VAKKDFGPKYLSNSAWS